MGAKTHRREGSKIPALWPLQEVVLLMLLPPATDFATCRAGFVADWQLFLTTRSYSSLHAWRVWSTYQRWCLPKYKTKGACLSCKKGLFHFSLNVLPCQFFLWSFSLPILPFLLRSSQLWLQIWHQVSLRFGGVEKYHLGYSLVKISI